MRVGFYPKLAVDSIRKNKKMFTPFILTCVGMVMMFYIIMYIGLCSVPDSMMGAESVRSMLQHAPHRLRAHHRIGHAA